MAMPAAAPAAETALRTRLDRFLKGVERRAYRMAMLATQDQQDALELVQEAMLGFVRSYAEKPEADWLPLFWRVLDSRVQDHHRRQNVRRRWRVFFFSRDEEAEEQDPIESAPDELGLGPLERLVADQSAQAIQDSLCALPDRQRQAFLLRIIEGLDVAQTATAMGCSEGSVKTHLFRAMDALRRRLEAHR
jgi:RNA polymerase sigma-70 factor (ECF subfamily)